MGSETNEEKVPGLSLCSLYLIITELIWLCWNLLLIETYWNSLNFIRTYSSLTFSMWREGTLSWILFLYLHICLYAETPWIPILLVFAPSLILCLLCSDVCLSFGWVLMHISYWDIIHVKSNDGKEPLYIMYLIHMRNGHLYKILFLIGFVLSFLQNPSSFRICVVISTKSQFC